MRVIREIALEHARARAGARPLELHAAAFEIGGGAVALIGPKRSGKTTLLLHAVTRLGGRLVANDHVLVTGDGRLAVTGVPSVIAVRSRTAAAFPGLSGCVPRVEHPSQLALEEIDRALEAAGAGCDTEGRLRFSAALLARSLSVPLRATAPLRAVVLAEIGAATAIPRLARMTEEQARDRLRASVYGGPSREGETTIVAEMLAGARVARSRPAPATTGAEAEAIRAARSSDGGAEATGDRAAAILARVAADVPCWRLAPGDDIPQAIELLWRTALA
jgi:hypothetical protein